VEVFPPSATDVAFHDGLWAGRVESAVIAGGAYYLYQSATNPTLDDDDDDEDGGEVFGRELAETRALMTELKAEFKQTDPLVAAIQRPADGRYEGRSAEDDDGDQPVVTELTFLKDGTVQGWGADGVDGGYVVKDGVWSTASGEGGAVGARVAWIEAYDEGFEVALRGQVRADGTIRAMWASSVGVSGSVELARE